MTKTDRQVLAAEVLELGQQLFALALEQQGGASQDQGRVQDEPGEEAYPVGEIEEASREFFVALRLLLGVQSDQEVG